MKNRLVFAFILFSCFGLTRAQKVVIPFNQPPAWAKSAVWYQIFVERFSNGDKNNEPTPEFMNDLPLKHFAPEGWSVTPWTNDWWKQEAWEQKANRPFDVLLQFRRYGGDLQGVLDKLDYLQDLGITAIFINPINDATSLHKYDARNYHHVDINFGPDPKGDIAIIYEENPVDTATWKWTSADKLFLKVIQEVHKRKMKIIVDYSWNHTGVMFWAWQDILKNQDKSVYKNWYNIKRFDDPATPGNEFSYSGWANVPSMPEVNKVNITTKRESGHPYEGDIAEGPKKHIFDVTRRWLAPDGDTSRGIDGFRLDVADQIGMVFWRDYRKFVHSIQPNAYLIGEIWWEKFPDQLMNPVPYTSGDVFDAVMFYQAYRPARYFFAKTNYEIDAKQLKDSLEFQWKRLSQEVRYAMMNVSSSHDAPRLLTDFYNPNKYKFQASPRDNRNYRTGKPDEETYQRLRLYLVHLFTTIGAPQIWNGEEMGMWGGDDPHCRKPLSWKEFTFEPETRNNVQKADSGFDKIEFNEQQFDWYKKLIEIRRKNPVLSTGEFSFILAEGKKLIYKRTNNEDEIIVCFNLEKNKQMFCVNEKGSFIDLLTGERVNIRKIAIGSLKAMILKKDQ